MVTWLLELDVDANYASNDGWTPLHMAVQNGHLAIAKQLYAKGALLDARSKDGFTPLHQAASYGHSDTVRWLLERKADIKSTSNNDMTTLDIPAEKRHLTVSEPLLADGCLDLDAQDSLGFTVLHLAVHRCHAEIVSMLIKAGADFRSLDPYGYSSLDWASRNPEAFNSIRSLFRDCASTSEADRLRQLKASILKAIRQLSGERQWNLSWVLPKLGRFLLSCGDEENACYAFMQDTKQENGILRHNCLGDMCQPKAKIVGTRYTYRYCLEVDLCNSCKQKYDNGATTEGCRSHSYLSIPLEESNVSISSFSTIWEPSMDIWLAALESKYGAAA